MASRTRNLIAIAGLVVPISMAQVTTVQVDQITNWPAPLYWQPASTRTAEPVHHGRIRESAAVKAAAATLGTPAVFVAMSPCRVVETRNPDGPYGGPAFAAGETRTYPIPAGPCAGIPASAVAFSLNIAVIPLGTTMRWLTAWDTGSTQPNAATLNDKAGLITSNSAVVPAGTGGEINIFVTDPTHVIVDINDLAGNTAVGTGALARNTTGIDNTAIGPGALQRNTTGSANTAIGGGALQNNTTANDNIAIGPPAAQNVSGSNSDNIHIGSQGSIADSGTIRIGTPGTQTSFFAAGVRGVTTANNDAIPVVIDSNGQLGTISSSRRVKRDIEDMGDTTDTILALHPVRFRYKAHGPDSPLQYGLIAEEVAETASDLMARNKDGEIETVYYDKVNAMLLNEVQKLHREFNEQQKMNQKLESRLADLESRIK